MSDPATADPVIAYLRRNAAAALAEHPAIECVVLFGSRARGDHRPDSDYDVAILTADGAADHDLYRAIEGDRSACPHAVIDTWVIEARRIRTQGHLLGNLAHDLREDARPLAGPWNPREDNAMPTAIHTDDDTIENHLGQMAQNLKNAALSRAEFSAGRHPHDANQQYQETLQMTAEFWGKATLIVLGVRPHKIHDMAALAQELRNHSHHEPDRVQWAAAIDSLDGTSRKRHIIPYEPQHLESITDADKRFVATTHIIGAWLESRQLVDRAPGPEMPKRQRMLTQAMQKVHDAIDAVRHYRDAGALPHTIVHAIDTLDQRCTSPGGREDEQV